MQRGRVGLVLLSIVSVPGIVAIASQQPPAPPDNSTVPVVLDIVQPIRRTPF